MARKPKRAKSRKNTASPSESTPSANDWKHPYLWSLGVAVSTLIVYILTLSPTVAGGDSGELIVAAHHGGIPHPPGYPLYTMLAHLLSYLPINEVAWRINLFSALCGSAAATLLFMAVHRWTRSLTASGLAAYLFAFSPLIWRYAVVAEVFALNNFFAALLLYLLVSFQQTKESRYVYWGAFAFGLGLSNHHTLVFIGLALFAFALISDSRRFLRPKPILSCLGLGALGLLPYLYLPWSGHRQLLISWGDPTTIDGFLNHFFRREYGTFQLVTTDVGKNNLFEGLTSYFMDFGQQVLWVGLVLALWGIYQLIKNKQTRALGLTTLLAFASYLVTFHSLANAEVNRVINYEIFSRFWHMPNVIACFWLGFGFYFLSKKVSPQQIKALSAAAIALILFQVAWNYKGEDHSSNDTFKALGESLLKPLPARSLLLVRGDAQLNSVRYLQLSLGIRPDVTVIPLGMLQWPWMKDLLKHHHSNLNVPYHSLSKMKVVPLKTIIEANDNFASVYLSETRPREEAALRSRYNIYPMGFLKKVIPKDHTYSLGEYSQEAQNVLAYIKFPTDDVLRTHSWEEGLQIRYLDQENLRAIEYIKKGDRKHLKKGVGILERAIARSSDRLIPASIYKNLGVAYQRLSQLDPNAQDKMVSAWQKYVERAPANDPDARKIKQILSK